MFYTTLKKTQNTDTKHKNTHLDKLDRTESPEIKSYFFER
jgi:hypothetical protein